MKFIAIPILILLLMSQTFSNWFVVLSFKIRQDYIAKNLCENRNRPQLHCRGNCVLMKKLKAQEKQEQNVPATLKFETSTVVISSRSFFATVENILINPHNSYKIPANSGKPVDMAASIFHPPSA